MTTTRRDVKHRTDLQYSRV